MEYGEHVKGLRGTIIAAGEAKPGDWIVQLERQSDIGNARPVTVTAVTPNGKAQVTLDGTRFAHSAVIPWQWRTSVNTLVFLVFRV